MKFVKLPGTEGVVIVNPAHVTSIRTPTAEAKSGGFKSEIEYLGNAGNPGCFTRVARSRHTPEEVALLLEKEA